MGYESKIVIVERTSGTYPSGKNFVSASEIARFDLCKMGYEQVNGKEFHKIFTIPIDFDIYVRTDEPEQDYDPEYWRVDCYGDHCAWATVDDVIDWLEQSQVVNEYRRAELFLDFCKALKAHESDYKQICLVHYGY